MQSYNMQRAIAVSNNVNVNDLDDQVVDYVHRVANIALMDEQFWADFILGASLFSIAAGYAGAW
jgi:hypothetical protein